MAASMYKLPIALIVLMTSLLCVSQGQECRDESAACGGWSKFCTERHKTVLIICRKTCNTCDRNFDETDQKEAIRNQQEANAQAQAQAASRDGNQARVASRQNDRRPSVYRQTGGIADTVYQPARDDRRQGLSRREQLIQAERDRLAQWQGSRNSVSNNRQSAARRQAAQREAARRTSLRRESERADALRREAARREAVQREAVQREAIEAAQREAAQKLAAQRAASRRQVAQVDAAQREAAQREAARRDQLRQAEERRRSRWPVASQQRGDCVDENPGCPYWTRFCTQAYSQVLMQCRKSCKVCTDPNSPPQIIDLFDNPLQGCKDDYPACDHWGDYCGERYSSVRKYCRKTCNTCNQSLTDSRLRPRGRLASPQTASSDRGVNEVIKRQRRQKAKRKHRAHKKHKHSGRNKKL